MQLITIIKKHVIVAQHYLKRKIIVSSNVSMVHIVLNLKYF